MKNRSVVTVAVGKTYYLKLATNLIKSFLFWHKKSDLHFLILTDNESYFQQFNKEAQITIKNLSVSESEKSFTSKFLLINNTIANENLFIDCDCLIYKTLDEVFDKMSIYDFTTIGKNLKTGEFFCNIPKIISHFDIDSLPTFVGSVYYFKNNDTAKRIFKKASELKVLYDELGFVRLRGKENEEPLFAVAMALNLQYPIPDDLSIKADLMHYAYWKTNVLKGKVDLYKKENNFLINIKPAIVHFNDKFSEEYPYLIDQLRLSNSNSNQILKNIIGFFRYRLPLQSLHLLKSVLRPIYHKVLGPSKIKKNKRI